MKKQIRSRKLKLQTETVQALASAELVLVNGGATAPCTHPTTTVLPSGPC
jgi:chloramphenicol 3-O-phosphotransferase